MDHNERIAQYESHLRDAERSIEAALRTICDLTGEEVNTFRYKLNYKALTEVQDAIRGTYRLYK